MLCSVFHYKIVFYLTWKLIFVIECLVLNSFAVIAAGCASCPKIKCERPGCDAYFCYHCKAEWHPNQTCDAARAQRSPNVRSSSVSFSQDSQHRKSCSGWIPSDLLTCTLVHTFTFTHIHRHEVRLVFYIAFSLFKIHYQFAGRDTASL